jgi:hypothetical protein
LPEDAKPLLPLSSDRFERRYKAVWKFGRHAKKLGYKKMMSPVERERPNVAVSQRINDSRLGPANDLAAMGAGPTLEPPCIRDGRSSRFCTNS